MEPTPDPTGGRASPHYFVAWASHPWIQDHGQDARATLGERGRSPYTGTLQTVIHRQSPVFIQSRPASGRPGRSAVGEAERLRTSPWIF